MWEQGQFAVVVVVLAVATALTVLLVRPSAFRRLLDLRIRGLWLLWVAAGIQALSMADPAWAAPLLDLRGGTVPESAIWLSGLAFTALNLRDRSIAVRTALLSFCAGFSMNSLTTLLNGGMPFSADAARRAGFSEDAIGSPAHHYQVISDDTLLPFFADVIPVAPLNAVISVGDVLMVAALAALPIALAWPRQAAPRSSGTAAVSEPPALEKGGTHAQGTDSSPHLADGLHRCEWRGRRLRTGCTSHGHELS